MRRSSLIVCALLVTASSGCERVKKQFATIQEQVKQRYELVRERFLKKKKPGSPVPVAHQPAAQPAPPPPPPPPPPPQSAEVKQVVAAAQHVRRDIPYVSEDTGTVFPGMSEKDVYSLWGPPVALRHYGEFTYIYFKNGCEYTCGHLDVVTLQNGQVVDAIVRWPGHGFAGQSTSPEGGAPHPRPGGDTLRILPPPTVNQSTDTAQAQPPPPPAPPAPPTPSPQ